jgi:hypothetical protein
VRNLWYDRKRGELAERREGLVRADAERPDLADPDHLGFVCFHLRYKGDAEPAPLYFIIEPTDLSAPTLFRSKNWHVNCLAPRYNNDPISVPGIEPHLRKLDKAVRSLDTVAGETLSSFWRRARGGLVEAVEQLPPQFELIRVFGE